MTFTQEQLKRVLRYDAATGAFTWIAKMGRMRPGDPAGTCSRGYILLNIFGRKYSAHRLAWFYVTGKWPKYQVDHTNGLRGDNRWPNLREATNSLNQQNLKKATSRSATGLLGVMKNKKRFGAVIHLNGQSYWLGTFNTPELAHAAYLTAKRKLHPGCTI